MSHKLSVPFCFLVSKVLYSGLPDVCQYLSISIFLHLITPAELVEGNKMQHVLRTLQASE